MSTQSLDLVVALLAVGFASASVACGPAAAGAPPATAADPPAASAAEPSSAPAASSAQDAPAGQLVCRANSVSDGVTELFLDWNGKAANGTLRQKAPSGMVYVRPVLAERYQGMIIVDEPATTDLVSHVATLVQRDGKLLLRVGGSGEAAQACE